MKTRTQNRTPKRLLSVFLSILMLFSSFVFVNPTISEAADQIIFDSTPYSINGLDLINAEVVCPGFGGASGRMKIYNVSAYYDANGNICYKDSVTNNQITVTEQIKSGGDATTTRGHVHDGSLGLIVCTYVDKRFGYYGDPKTLPAFEVTQSPTTFRNYHYKSVRFKLGYTDAYGHQTADYVSDDGSGPQYFGSSDGTYDTTNKINGGEHSTTLTNNSSNGLVNSSTGTIKCAFNPTVMMWSSAGESRYIGLNNSFKTSTYQHHDSCRHNECYQPSPINNWTGHDNYYTYSMYVGGNLQIIDSTNLYKRFKNLYVPYKYGYVKDISSGEFNYAMEAADTVLRGKMTKSIADKYGYKYICQELIDKIYAALDETKYLNTTFSTSYASSPAEASTVTGNTTVNFGTPLTVTITMNNAYSNSTPYIEATGEHGTLTFTEIKSKKGNVITFEIPVNDKYSKITAKGFKKNTYTVSVPNNDPTGLLVTNKGSHSVTHGDNFQFTVTKKTGYTKATPVVKVDGTQVVASSTSGNTYTYTISNVTGNKTVTIDNMPIDTYNVNYSLGTGVSKASGTATAVQYGGTATVKIDVDGAHNQVTSLPISVSNGTISGGTKSGNTFTYTLSDVTADTTVKVGDLTINKYNVNIPTDRTGLEIGNGGSHTVNYDGSWTFTVKVLDGYTQSVPNVKVNNKTDGFSRTFDESTNKYTYKIDNIRETKNVTIDNLELNKYKYDFSTGEGYTLADDTGFDHTAITHGNNYQFVVNVDKAYNQHTPVVKIESGKKVSLIGNGFDGEGNAFYVFEVENVTAHDKILVKNMTKNTYSAALPFETDEQGRVKYKVVNENADENNVVNGIVYGTDLVFSVDLHEQYDRSKVVVKYDGKVLEPTGKIYTIKNVTRNIGIDDTDPKITVEGVELNHYYITLPLETETGFVIEVADGLNAKSVLSGTDFGFRFFLDPAYSNSNPTIKVSRDGGKHYTVLTAKNGNEYTIDKVLSDCIVVVENVKKNTYTVKFVDGETVLDEHKDVLYGSDVSYEGETPTRATEKVSETTDENGNTVLVERKYKFIGWSQDTTNVTSNLTVTPIFEVSEVTTTTPAGGGEGETVITKKTATIRFISDGLTIHKETVNKGESFPGWNEVPVKTSSNPYETYEFLGWDVNGDGTPDYTAENNKIENVQDDIELVAVFKSNLPTRKVNFYNFDGSKLLYTADVKCGSRVVRELYGLDGSPARIDNKYEYTFSGWAYVKDGAKKDVIDKLVIGEGESAIDFFAAYSREKITYTYKYINDGTVMQEGSYNFVDEGQVTDVRYTGEIPKRASSKSTDYTFRYWVRSNVEGSRYDYIYTADYAESTREYTYTLPTSDGTYTVALGEGIGETIKWNEDLVFTVTLDEGHDQNAPVVLSNGKTVEAEKISDNTYKYVIRADGENADEIKAKLNKITVSTTINEYTIDVVKATNEGGDADASCTLSKAHFVTDYNGTVILKVTLNEGYTQTAPVLTKGEDDRVEITLESQEGNTYTYKLSGVKSNATITVTTKINEYRVIVYDWEKEIFNKNVKHGSTPDIKTPVKPADKNGAYKFIGYDTNNDGAADVKVIENVTAPVTAKALYDYNHHHDIDPDENPDIWELVKTEKATCTADGLKHYVCRHGDGQTTTKVIPARGHKWTAEGEGWIVVKAPTCTETGLKSRFCCNEENAEYKACNYKEENVVIPATGHHDADGDYKCDDCGADLGHCSSCICHKGNVLSKVIRKICTILSKTFHTKIKCCKCMKWYGDEISSIS